MSRARRLLSLVQLLRRYRQPVTAATLASDLGVSVRSIYRDVETLRGEGASIGGSPGLGYLLEPGFLLPPLMFRDEELEALVLGLGLASEHGDDDLARAAKEVMAKIRAVVPRDLRRVVDDATLLVGPRRKPLPIQVDEAAIRRAIREERKARIDYADGTGRTSERVIWPLGLGYFTDVRLVVAWCEARRDFRSFRADRIGTWVTLDARLPRKRAVLLSEWRAKDQHTRGRPADDS